MSDCVCDCGSVVVVVFMAVMFVNCGVVGEWVLSVWVVICGCGCGCGCLVVVVVAWLGAVVVMVANCGCVV